MTLATSNIYERVVKVETRGGLGAGTTIDWGGSCFLVTAAHVLPTDHTEPFTVTSRLRSHTGAPQRIQGLPDDQDLAITRLPPEFAQPNLPLPVSSADCRYSQRVVFLGFPYGLALTGGGVEGFLPFVKAATVSASTSLTVGALWYLDGLNNPGFSGGPVVFAPPGQTDVRMMAVVSGYRPDWQHVQRGDAADEEARIATNSGIMLAYDVKPVVDALEAL